MATHRARRILIVEDEWLIATAIEQMLSGAGFEIAGKVGAVDLALAAIAEHDCDAVVLDANLDGASAAPVAQALQLRAIPFVVVSGYANEQRTGPLAAAPYIGKPVASASLIAVVRSLVFQV